MQISVIIVCRNEEINIQDCLESILRQTIQASEYEVIIIDNNSSDMTREIAREFAEKYPNVTLHNNPIPGIAASRKTGIEKAACDYVAFTDADCIVPANWLQILKSGFERYSANDNRLAGVGGTNIPPENSRFYEALEILLRTFWGNHGSAQGKQYAKDSYVPHLPTVNVLYRKQAITDIGSFDESFGNICEDVDLSHRLVKQGWRLLFLKDSHVIHRMRSGFYSWMKNMITYGKGRIWVIKKHPSHFRLMYLAPIILVMALGISPLGFLNPWYAVSLLYFPIIAGISLREAIKVKKINIFPLVMMIYIITHIAYGIGELYGLFSRRGI